VLQALRAKNPRATWSLAGADRSKANL
jgi:hypothetical protein